VNFVFFVVAKRSASLLGVIIVVALAAACGKKGPPLAPIVRIPEAVSMIHAQRVGSAAYVTVTVPAKNIDGSMPVDISRIEVYGYTGRRPPPSARWVEVAQLVATIPVVPPPPPDAPPPPEPSPEEPSKGAFTGSMVTVIDSLTPQKLEAGRVIEEPRRGLNPPPAATPIAATEPEVLQRFYMAIAFSKRGRPGPPGTATQFPLVPPPAAPAFVNARYTETAMNLEWPPSGGIVGFFFGAPLPPEDAPLDAALEPIAPAPAVEAGATGPVTYNVYREVGPDPLAFPDSAAPVPWAASTPVPLNPTPLTATTFTDTVEFDRERCYTVRPLRGAPPNAVEGDASPPNCFIPVDLFPPAAPAHLAAVPDAGGISLIWEPNGEADVSGYMVLRGNPGDATLQPLTQVPVADARFRDTHVEAGKKYVYAVVALDSRLPVANVSAESNRVEETAR
jgi:hypothetical protein